MILGKRKKKIEQPVARTPWILHANETAECGCGFILTFYENDPDIPYADGSERITILRCKDHPKEGCKLNHFDAVPRTVWHFDKKGAYIENEQT